MLQPISIFEMLKYKEKISILKMAIESDLYGLAISKGDAKAILINTNNSLGRQYFSAAHEYYHLKYEVNFNHENDDLEKEADSFASYLLLPREALRHYLIKRLCDERKKIIDISDCLYLENFFKVSHHALVFRLLKDGHIKKNKYDYFMGINIKKEALKHGYTLELYEPTNPNKELIVNSDYAELAEKVLEKGKISESKYFEYLLTGGYEKILFGDDADE